jgi:hypothetical protein
MDNKKTYSPPQLFRVELNQEQAILSACSLLTISVAAGSNVACRPSGTCEGPPNNGTPGGCKRSSLPAACGNSGPRAS